MERAGGKVIYFLLEWGSNRTETNFYGALKGGDKNADVDR